MGSPPTSQQNKQSRVQKAQRQAYLQPAADSRWAYILPMSPMPIKPTTKLSMRGSGLLRGTAGSKGAMLCSCDTAEVVNEGKGASCFTSSSRSKMIPSPSSDEGKMEITVVLSAKR